MAKINVSDLNGPIFDIVVIHGEKKNFASLVKRNKDGSLSLSFEICQCCQKYETYNYLKKYAFYGCSVVGIGDNKGFYKTEHWNHDYPVLTTRFYETISFTADAGDKIDVADSYKIFTEVKDYFRNLEFDDMGFCEKDGKKIINIFAK